MHAEMIVNDVDGKVANPNHSKLSTLIMIFQEKTS